MKNTITGIIILLAVLTGIPAWADESGDKVRDTFERVDSIFNPGATRPRPEPVVPDRRIDNGVVKKGKQSQLRTISVSEAKRQVKKGTLKKSRCIDNDCSEQEEAEYITLDEVDCSTFNCDKIEVQYDEYSCPVALVMPFLDDGSSARGSRLLTRRSDVRKALGKGQALPQLSRKDGSQSSRTGKRTVLTIDRKALAKLVPNHRSLKMATPVEITLESLSSTLEKPELPASVEEFINEPERGVRSKRDIDTLVFSDEEGMTITEDELYDTLDFSDDPMIITADDKGKRAKRTAQFTLRVGTVNKGKKGAKSVQKIEVYMTCDSACSDEDMALAQALADKFNAEMVYPGDAAQERKSSKRSKTGAAANTATKKVDTRSLNKKLTDGKYYALIVGINRYKQIGQLENAAKDAIAVDTLLKSQYGFETTLILEEQATRDNIMKALNEYRKKLKEDDSLMIYYSGHGHFDPDTGTSFWMPVDADQDDTTRWLEAKSITDQLKLMSTKHILVMADSCFSGTMTRKPTVELSRGTTRENFLNKLFDKPSRVLIASGGNEPVTDGGAKGHSIFANAFINALNQPFSEIFTAEELMSRHLKESVAGRTEQTPEYSVIRNSGHDGGDFIFVKKDALQ
jgi:hypothetical protein